MASESIQLLSSNIADMTKQLSTFNGNWANLAKSGGNINGFAEPSSEQNGFAQLSLNPQGLFQAHGNIIVMALGAALSGTVAGLVGRFLPIGSGGIIKVVGAIILNMIFGKMNPMVKSFLQGVMLAGIAEFLSGLTGGIKLFGEPRPSIGANIPQAMSSPVFSQPPMAYAGVKYY